MKLTDRIVEKHVTENGTKWIPNSARIDWIGWTWVVDYKRLNGVIGAVGSNPHRPYRTKESAERWREWWIKKHFRKYLRIRKEL